MIFWMRAFQSFACSAGIKTIYVTNVTIYAYNTLLYTLRLLQRYYTPQYTVTYAAI